MGGRSGVLKRDVELWGGRVGARLWGIMSSATYACFRCRLVLRRVKIDPPRLHMGAMSDVRCGKCRESCNYIGQKLDYPKNREAGAWKQLEDRLQADRLKAGLPPVDVMVRLNPLPQTRSAVKKRRTATGKTKKRPSAGKPKTRPAAKSARAVASRPKAGKKKVTKTRQKRAAAKPVSRPRKRTAKASRKSRRR